MAALPSRTTHKVNADGRDVALCVCVVLQNKGKRLRLSVTRGQQLLSTTDIWGLSALGCSDEQQPPGTHRKPEQQAGLADAGVSNQQQLQHSRGKKL